VLDVQHSLWPEVVYCCMINRGGHAQLFFESAIAISQLVESTSAIAIPQHFKKCCSATAIPQSQFFPKSATSSPNLRPSLPQFSAFFWPWSGLKLYIFLPPGFFCFWDDFKGTVAQDFRPLFFRESTHMNLLSHTIKDFPIRLQIAIAQL
jgi:hypothetical protein